MVRSLRDRQWSRPLLLAVFLAAGVPLQIGVGWWVLRTLDRSMKVRLEEELTTILDADVTALKLWLGAQEQAVNVAASQLTVRELVGHLVEASERPDVTSEALRDSDELRQLREYVKPLMGSYALVGFVVIDRNGRFAGSLDDDAVGTRVPAQYAGFIERILGGETVVTPPLAPEPAHAVEDADGPQEPTMFAAAPIRDETGSVIGVLGFRFSSISGFTQILQIARSGATGETYAFNSNGLLLSDSRFVNDLRAIGLIPDDPDARAILQIEIRDPGGNMLEGFRPSVPLSALPLTRMAADATQGVSGVDVDGYRDYRGVPVVGAWTWLPDYGFGVTTEVDVAEAYSTLYVLRTAFWALVGVLAISALMIALSYRIIGGLRRRVRRAEKLGQYTLDKKIGEGGMGTVYTAHHAMLRRPTAIKLLRNDAQDDEKITRFEREVQHTSKLTHPNTIAIYDYGRTPEGTFYYAMEYLPGITLDTLVASDGPQPEARVIHILSQACASLAEAHAAGMIHRDVKPSNIMLCERGGVFDVVKVLDFGLVKDIKQSGETAITAVNAVAGTPLYLSPEAIVAPDQTDARSDIYCIGAVGYFLLAGQPVFQGENAMVVFSHHVSTQPQQPSQRIGRQLSTDLEEIILRCLEKDKAKRPQSAQKLREELSACVDAGKWTEAEAYRWWADHPSLADVTDLDAGDGSDSDRIAAAVAVALQDRVSTDSG